LFWLLIGSLEAQNIEVRDPAFSTTQKSGYISFYIIFLMIVALSILIAMMSNSFEIIMIKNRSNDRNNDKPKPTKTTSIGNRGTAV